MTRSAGGGAQILPVQHGLAVNTGLVKVILIGGQAKGFHQGGIGVTASAQGRHIERIDIC